MMGRVILVGRDKQNDTRRRNCMQTEASFQRESNAFCKLIVAGMEVSLSNYFLPVQQSLGHAAPGPSRG